MEIFLAQALVFLGLEMILLGALILYAFYKAGWSKEEFMKNWIKAEGGKTSLWKGISVILIVPILLAGILYAGNADADTKYFNGAKVFVGIDNTAKASPLCESGGLNDRLTSNIGFVQNFIEDDVMTIGAKYTHHSCALNPDMNAYDSIGVVLEWKIW